MEVKNYIPINCEKKEMYNILANISKYSEDKNSTIMAFKNYFTDIKTNFEPTKKVAFSSQEKWSGINFKEVGTYIIGAPEMVLKEKYNDYKKEIEKYSKDYRVIVLAHSNENFNEKKLPNNLDIKGLILVSDKIRKEAKNTIQYFYDQEVDVKIISGDNPITVSQIAKQVGIKNFDKYIDMSKIESTDNLQDIVDKYSIFGRVSPTLKKDLVLALKSKRKNCCYDR